MLARIRSKNFPLANVGIEIDIDFGVAVAVDVDGGGKRGERLKLVEIHILPRTDHVAWEKWREKMICVRLHDLRASRRLVARAYTSDEST